MLSMEKALGNLFEERLKTLMQTRLHMTKASFKNKKHTTNQEKERNGLFWEMI